MKRKEGRAAKSEPAGGQSKFKLWVLWRPDNRNLLMLIIISAFALAGGIWTLRMSGASPLASSKEAEAGSLAGNQGPGDSAGASGGASVKFGAAAPSPSPTPTPPPGGCAVSTPHVADGPDGMGGCWPGPSNTGVPAGTVVAAYSGPCTITTASTVIDSKAVNCDLDIQAANVMVKNSKVNGLVVLDTDLSGSGGWSFTLQDSEVDGGAQQRAAVSTGNMTIIRSNIHGGITAAQCEEKSVSCTVSDSWLHGQYIQPNSNWHLGGFLSDGGGPISLTHNTVVCDQSATYGSDGGCTGDINLIPNFAVVHDVTLSHNLLGSNSSSAFCTYGGEKSTSPYPHANHVVYQGNVFQHGSNRLCASYGPVTDFNSSGTGNQWLDNTWEDGTAVPPAN